MCIARDSGVRLRDIAAAVGVTERAAQRILGELVREGYVLREPQGRRNRYQVVPDLPLRHLLVEEREVGDLLEVLIGSAPPAADSGPEPAAGTDRRRWGTDRFATSERGVEHQPRKRA